MQKPRREQKAMTGLFLIPDATCKICLESASSEDLIHPCKCTGSIHYVHEECLKIWILSNFKEIDQAQCELCNYRYLINYKIVSVCNLSKETCSCNPRIVLIVKLLIIQFLIWLLIIDIYIKINDTSHVIVLVLFLIISVFAAFSAFRLTILLIFKQWTAKQLKNWTISNYEGPATQACSHSTYTINTGKVIPELVVVRGLEVLPPRDLEKGNDLRTHTEYDSAYSDRTYFAHNRTKSQNYSSLAKHSYN